MEIKILFRFEGKQNKVEAKLSKTIRCIMHVGDKKTYEIRMKQIQFRIVTKTSFALLCTE